MDTPGQTGRSAGSVSFEERSVMLEEQTAGLTLTAAGAIPKDNDDVTGYVEMVSNDRRRQFSELSREDVTVRKLVHLQVITLHAYPSFSIARCINIKICTRLIGDVPEV
ncbi:hypothetical protein EYF80_035940 [Liparis tanakae]|uniref:Uncharacterized protein n=1 Tax=Liparis tanakae TaxID=230148 RepID=A0A4Z2GKN6_9TELE|nr:hypothetical protein EYF80_035940 [Liparis tanakae]